MPTNALVMALIRPYLRFAALTAMLLIGCSAALSQPVAGANKLFRIGYVGGGTPGISGSYLRDFLNEMRLLGHQEGKDLQVKALYANGEYGRLPAIAKELASGGLDLFLVGSEQSLLAAKAASSSIPIAAVTCDSIERFVGSLNRPGGNATGITCFSSALVGKRFGYLKQLVPGLRRIAYLHNAEDDVDTEFKNAQADGKELGLTPIRFPVRSENDFAAAFDTMVKQRCGALYVSVSAFTNFHRKRLAELALSHRLPSINGFPEYAEAGGLISYGATLTDGFKHVAHVADKIMHGASPRDIPAEEPKRFYLVVNLATARTLKIKVPSELLVQADRTVE